MRRGALSAGVKGIKIQKKFTEAGNLFPASFILIDRTIVLRVYQADECVL